MRILSSTSKPISSPGRTEKFPPPLMRFLRSNVGSRSRGRPRASPLFMRRKKAIAASSSSSAIETTQEPSSPKVTCIGQVRVRRSRSKSKSKKMSGIAKTAPAKNSRSSACCCCNCNCCGWFKQLSFCGLRLWNCKKPSCGNCNWVSCFNCRSVKVRTDSSKFGSNRFEPHEDNDEEEEEEEETTGRRQSISIDAETIMMMEAAAATTTASIETPPKNALLLTRCRSAPYRSSSLACRFWGSPENRPSGIELSRCTSSRDSTSEPRADQQQDTTETGVAFANNVISRISFKKLDFGVCENSTTSIKICNNDDHNNEINNSGSPDSKEDKKNDDDGEEEEEGDDDEFPKGVVLVRCKSEPTRRCSEKLNPESSEFWRHRRLGNTETSTPHSHSHAVH